MFESRRVHGCLSLVSVVCRLCDELIPRAEEFYRLWGVTVCATETLRMRRPWLALGCCAEEEEEEEAIAI